MAQVILKHVQLFTIFIVVLCHGLVSALNIDITPTTVNKFITDEVDITCTANKSSKGTESVVIIELGKDEERPLAVLRLTQLIYGDGVTANIKAEGRIIQSKASDSYLRLTIKDPEASNAGRYVCRMFYMDDFGNLKESKAHANLTVDSEKDKTFFKHLLQRLSDLENVVDSLQTNNTHCEMRNDAYEKHLKEYAEQMREQDAKDQMTKETIDNLHSLLKDQRNITENQERQLEAQEEVIRQMNDSINHGQVAEEDFYHLDSLLKDQMSINDNQERKLEALEEVIRQTNDPINHSSSISAFSSNYCYNTAITQWEKLVFGGVVFKLGQDYNPNTGVYTAPHDGVYVFHFRVTSSYWADIYFEVNDENMFTMLTGSDSSNSSNTENSPSAVFFLWAYDRVNLRIKTIPAGYSMEGIGYSSFSGYLLHQTPTTNGTHVEDHGPKDDFATCN